MSTRRVTLITGASGGIGADLARVFARQGHDLALVARSQDKLDALANEIEVANPGRPRPLVIALDLVAADAGDHLETRLKLAGADVEILINNAGFGLAGEARQLDRAEQLSMIDLNVRCLTDLTLRFVEPVRKAGGAILNVASTAAFQPGPGMAVYYATKAFVLSFSEAMWEELKEAGVTVSALCPGPTLTGFQARANLALDNPLMKRASMAPLEVAEAGYKGLMAGERVIVPGALNKFTAFTAPLTPHALLLPLVAQMQAKKRQEP